MTSEHTRRELAALAELVERFGADRTRWPAEQRLRFAGLVAEADEAQRILAEAAALDELLDRAPRVSSPRQRALADRIAQAVASEAEAGNANVVELGPRRTGNRGQPSWRMAALLAASLLLGVFAGSTGLIDDLLATGTEIASDDIGLADEDFL